MNKGKINPVPALVAVSNLYHSFCPSAICNQPIILNMLSESPTYKWNKIGAHFLVGNENHEQCATRAETLSERCRQQHFQCIVESRFNDNRRVHE